MCFGFEGLNLDAPPAILLLRECRFHLVNGHLGIELPNTRGRAEKINDCPSPRLHQGVGVKLHTRNPGVGGPPAKTKDERQER
jgi:hypothetical protein